MKRFVLAVVLVGSLAGTVVAFLLVASGHEGEPNPGNLLAPGRTTLSICVDAAGRSPTNADVDAVSMAIETAFAAVPRVPPEYTEPTVVSGCPTPIALAGQALDFYDLCCNLYTTVMDSALLSPHRLLVYFVDDETYSASFAPLPAARVVAERLCRGDVCSEMTVANYLPESATNETLADGISQGLALDLSRPEPTFDAADFVASCERGTPVAGCERYLMCLTPGADEDCDAVWRELGLEPPY